MITPGPHTVVQRVGRISSTGVPLACAENVAAFSAALRSISALSDARGHDLSIRPTDSDGLVCTDEDLAPGPRWGELCQVRRLAGNSHFFKFTRLRERLKDATVAAHLALRGLKFVHGRTLKA